jgi:hypothetical protein
MITRFAAIALPALLLANCSVNPKALSGANAGAATVLGFYATSADIRQQLALDTIKESSQLEYLSKRMKEKSTCRDNAGYMAPKDYRAARNIKAETIARFESADTDYKFLVKYSKVFDNIVKEADNATADINDFVAITKGLGQYNTNTKAMSDIVSLLGAAAVAVNEEVKFQKIRKAAGIYQKELEDHAKTLSGRLSGLDRQTMRDIAVWRECVEEKFKVIAALAHPNYLPTSAVELDAAYAAFQAQYRSYVGASPQEGTMLQDLIDANKAISVAPNWAGMRDSIQRYLVIFDNSRAAIAKAGALSEQ